MAEKRKIRLNVVKNAYWLRTQDAKELAFEYRPDFEFMYNYYIRMHEIMDKLLDLNNQLQSSTLEDMVEQTKEVFQLIQGAGTDQKKKSLIAYAIIAYELSSEKAIGLKGKVSVKAEANGVETDTDSVESLPALRIRGTTDYLIFAKISKGLAEKMDDIGLLMFL